MPENATRLSVTGLSHPPGKNNRHMIGRPFVRGGGRGEPRIILTVAARAWLQEVELGVRSAMLRTGTRLPAGGLWWIGVLCHVFSLKMDADAPLSLALDGIEMGLGLNDTYVCAAPPVKRLVGDKRDRHVDLYITLVPVADADAWNALSDDVMGEMGAALGWQAVTAAVPPSPNV